jgi:hypothetical protein
MYFFFMGVLAALMPSAIVLGLIIWKAGIARPPNRTGARVLPFQKHHPESPYVHRADVPNAPRAKSEYTAKA